MRRLSRHRQHAWVLTGLFLVAALAVTGFGLAVRADAQTSFSVESIGSQLGLGDADLRQVVINVIRWVLGILTLTAVVYMMYGGYLWLTAAGNEKRVEKAKQVILQAAIGLVIVLLSWAIVFFVARSIANVTNQSNTNSSSSGDPCNPLVEDCGEVTTFDITNIASCSAGEANANVPRSSAIQLTFNANLKDGAVQQAVADDVTNANPPNLIVQKCANNDCANPANLSTPVPLENQRYITGTTPTTTGTPPQADWTQNGKVVTFYHVANDTLAADARLFEAGQKYLLTIPAKSASKALLDAQDRKLDNCRRQSSSIEPLPGCATADADRITWEFTTGSDVDGPDLNVDSAFPSFAYQSSDVSPNRSVSRASFLSVQYNTTIDFNTLTTNNFKVYKCGTGNIPTAANDWNECDDETANQVPAGNFEIQPRPDGRGGILRIITPPAGTDPFTYEAFTWYKVEVSNVRSLCGRVQEPPSKTWVFQTNDAVPGVKKVYPRDGYQNACPATRVFIQYATSMWDGTSFDCNVGGGSYVSRGLLTNNPGRNFIPSSPYDPDDPETCTMYEFTPTTALLSPNTTYEARVESDLVIDSNGRKLNYGYAVAGSTTEGPWSFRTATASTCAQEPVITKISPGQGPDGLCLSVIGDYFEKVNYPDVNADAPDAGDSLTLRATNQTADTWANEYIVSSLGAGTLTKNASHPYVVTVNYPAPIGPLQSSPENFYLTDDSASQGPCLTKLSPTKGPVGTTVTATGKRLGTSGEVRYSTKTPPQWTVAANSWTPTRIENISVDAGSPSGLGDVTVVSGGLESNALPFTVKSSTSGGSTGEAPRIDVVDACSNTRTPSPNPRQGETSACINAWPSARFVNEVNPATLNPTTIIFEQCDAAYTTCSMVAGYSIVPFANYRGFKIDPGANLTPATAYRVTVRSVESPDGVVMTTPYQWRFTTKPGNAPCPVERVIIQQSDRTYRDPFTLGLPTEVMDGACNSVNGNGLTYAWSNTDDAICALQSGYTGPANVCRSPDPINEGATTVQVSLPAEGISSNQVRISANLVACETSAQCACGGVTTSQCIGGSCTPVITSISPDNGRVGTWTTIQGCWFGKYADTKSKVIFTNNKEGLIPTTTGSACTASNTWTNTQIVREVPTLQTPANDTADDAITGPIQVVRRDLVTATGPTFTVNAEEYPKICRIDPSSRYPTELTTVYGKDLGDDQGSGDVVRVSDSDSAAVTPFTAYPQWDADRIGAVVPTPTPIVGSNVYGSGSVRVTHLGKTSNPLAMTLKNPADPSSGTDSCAAADQCVFGDDTSCGVGRGCGFNHCCAARPVVTGTRPAVNETDICRNTQVQVDFSQPLLSSSVTAATIHYYNGPQVTSGKIGLLNDNTTITYEPGLLSPSMDQRMSLAGHATVSIAVTNGSFENANAGVPTGWGTPSFVTQSTEHPSGSGNASALADCTTAGCAQAFITQDIETASTAVRAYRVTGWVKADVAPGSIGGLISQCYGTGACSQANRTKTFDRWGDAPGLFDNRTGTSRLVSDWKKVDFLVTNPNGLNIGLRLNCFANPNAKIWCDDFAVTRVTDQPTLLRGTTGVLADTRYNQQPGTDPFNLTFTSSATICAMDRVVVVPSSKILTAANQLYTPAPVAQVYSGRRAAPLSEVPGVYEWSWRWERVGGSDAIATVQNQDSATTAVRAGTAPGQINAKAIARVTVDSNNNATLNREASGQSKVTVDFCVNPWFFTDQASNCTANPNPGSTAEDQCPSFHFRLYYCAGGAEPLLNHRAIEGRNSVDTERKKSFFFKESVSSQDTIGMLVYANPELLSPYDWYNARFTNSAGSSTTIGGYPAVRTGTTAYIGVTDLTDAGQLKGYMVVIDFNSNNASPTTQSIYNRILNGIEFNATQPLSVEDREAIISDTQRVQDLRSIKTLLEAYKATNNRYPDLPSGSYISGFSTSAWPSWRRELANTLGRTLPNDPANGFTPSICQAPYEAASCWAETLQQFQCPVGSQVYSYKTINGGAGYELFANLQYTGLGGFNNYSGNPCSGLGTNNTCACFNYRLSTP